VADVPGEGLAGLNDEVECLLYGHWGYPNALSPRLAL
jgi:hypothetical protein